MRLARRFLMLGGMLAWQGFSLQAEEITVEYVAVAATVVGTPFGIDVPRETVVTGRFTYDTESAVDANQSAQKGDYELMSSGGFVAAFAGHVITGSDTPFWSMEDLECCDTIRFRDGDRNGFPNRGMMALNGIPAEDIGVSLSITDGSGSAFVDDSLPSPFPFTFPLSGFPSTHPHTFSLGDDNGGMLLGFRLLAQIPNRLVVTEFFRDGNRAGLIWRSVEGRSYQVEFSTDLVNWVTVQMGVVAPAAVTLFAEDLAVRLGIVPVSVYYRVREEAPG